MTAILVINPGSTSTKVALYEDNVRAFQETIDHSMVEIDAFVEIVDQLDMRTELVEKLLEKYGVDRASLSAVIGRGGLLPNVSAGGYRVNEDMIIAFMEGLASPHASNLGALIADRIAKPSGIPAFIYDCVSADEFDEIAKITGMPDYRRESMCHVLNQKAVARVVAEKYGKGYDQLRAIVAHLGGGISIGVHSGGRIIDCIRDDAGPFSPERSGSIPLLAVISMCYTGDYNRREMIKRVRGMGGIKAYLGTTDMREVEEMIDAGNELAKKVYEAQAYQICKGIGEMAPVLSCDMDCIILTGGMACSQRMNDMISERIFRLAPVEIVPGEDEMNALYLGASRILSGEEQAKVYALPKRERRF